MCSCTDDFFAAIQIISAETDTCLEIYKVDGENYTLQASKYLQMSHSVYTYTANRNHDITGYFVNSSKPITVVAGHSCAFVPEGVFFCDHMVEHIPPADELGLTHVVPPIVGRLINAGYTVGCSHNIATNTQTQAAIDAHKSGAQKAFMWSAMLALSNECRQSSLTARFLGSTPER